MRRNKSEMYSHIVWTTWRREAFISDEIERAVYRCLESQVKDMDCELLAIGGMPDHVHIIIKVPPKRAISDLMHKVKGVSSRFVHDKLPGNEAFKWQEGFGTFSVGRNQVSRAIAYVNNQKQHHADNTIYPDWEEPDEIVDDEEPNEPS